MRSIYHIREYCVRKLSLVCNFHVQSMIFSKPIRAAIIDQHIFISRLATVD